MRPAMKILVAAGIPLLLLAAVIGYQARGVAVFPGQPTTIVTVRLATVMEKLDEHAEAQAALTTMAEQMKTTHEQRRADLQKMQDEYIVGLQNAPGNRESGPANRDDGGRGLAALPIDDSSLTTH